ncbi:unnamed protein product [Urochloa decumbens]|uniref:Kinesin-like protein n=1 Tax=Urochloa decumbens TaxID=240449 RepID=A0ABC8WI68_9POAL
MEKISVAVRFRPPTPTPTAGGTSSTSSGGGGDREWRIEDARVSLLHGGSPVHGASFSFDHVFDGAATNARVYGVLVRPVIRAAVDGFNGTVFAYGQTSSGKTHTMSGSGADPGVIELAVRDLFDTARQAVDREFCFKVSYMEIYNEDINDLLTLGSQKLQILDNLKHEACVEGLREDVVESAEQTLDLLELGETNRHFGQSNMNVRSTRSHTIFRMVIESRAKNKMDFGDAIRVSVLNLVDLAGSERTSKTGAQGIRLEEGKFINKSLMNLGIVINRLSGNGKKMGHIPYRGSKLTRILEPALGGNAKTSIICTAYVAPILHRSAVPVSDTYRRVAVFVSAYPYPVSVQHSAQLPLKRSIHIDETKGTLQFANRAKYVSNCAQVNEIFTDAVLIERQKQEIKELRKRLQGSDSEAMEQLVLNQCDDIRKYKLELDRLTMELEQERKLREEERISQETLEHQLPGEKKTQEDLNNTSTSSDQFTSSIEYKLELDRLTMEIEQERKLREERILQETLEHQLSGEKKTLEDLKKASTSSDHFISSIEPGPTEEQDCSSVRQVVETELELLREENSLLVQELSRSKEEAGCAVAKMQELEVRCQKLEEDRIADRQEAEEECNLLREETSCLLLELNRSKQEAGRLVAEKQAQVEGALARCAALEEELSASRREAERLAAEKRDLATEKLRWSTEAAEREVDAAAVGWELSQREEQLARLLAKSKAIVAHASCMAAEQQAAVPCP